MGISSSLGFAWNLLTLFLTQIGWLYTMISPRDKETNGEKDHFDIFKQTMDKPNLPPKIRRDKCEKKTGGGEVSEYAQ